MISNFGVTPVLHPARHYSIREIVDLVVRGLVESRWIRRAQLSHGASTNKEIGQGPDPGVDQAVRQIMPVIQRRKLLPACIWVFNLRPFMIGC